MTRDEHLIVCLAEECDEVGQRVSKALRFGLAEVQPGQSLTNAQRITEELRDLLAVASHLARVGLIPAPRLTPEMEDAKIAKIETFMAISRKQGALS